MYSGTAFLLSRICQSPDFPQCGPIKVDGAVVLFRVYDAERFEDFARFGVVFRHFLINITCRVFLDQVDITCWAIVAECLPNTATIKSRTHPPI